ncbi:uncharacterized protein SPPG_06049 [Spizellomyces punctatus DAOM BR117]|uniref:Ferric oxidoreductase domain-containing protein n=1 Tax=Spizellomyces punctatus (strain DAOM BR117) TaxID=645134 RepID=A0A0L0HDR6_SPIPD|nr:uncharacterized protein SPPG_06049 [Spizellomyces punctatus DAOM BR117]KNC99104.1 hypothetical protein SPPG_06049 [Spizellomyces punctatus DAOM BR117]|eukprot:XP_016607144.1 hypothetical protein SPPG_06049 [Spizellomyces punctatus DAOM BR117]
MVRPAFALALALGFVTALLPAAVYGMTDGRPGYGFIGYGINMYHPTCASACRDSIKAPLNCTSADMGQAGHSHNMRMKRDLITLMKRMGIMGDGKEAQLPSGDGWMVMKPTPACKVHNDFYLQTLAFCISQRCEGISLDHIEKFWANDVAGRALDQPAPTKSYTEAHLAATSSTRQTLNNKVFLNYTGIVTDDTYTPNINALTSFERVEVLHSRYGLIIFLSGAIIPIFLSFLRFLPWPASVTTKFHAHVIDPPLFGSKYNSPILRGLVIMPTRGQALFIAYYWILNVVLSAVNLSAPMPDAWFSDVTGQVVAYLANRVGVLSFANLPLVLLYAGRNNILLWLTNWSHATFLLIHRWIAFICMLQAALHSALYLYAYMKFDDNDYASESKLPYWYWGIIATLSLVITIPASVLPIRRKVYELFLSSHIVLAILALVGCYLHIYHRFKHQWGYETWIYVAVGIWAFDRLLRLARLFYMGGFKRAYVTAIDDDYYQVDIPGVDASGHVYFHFPTLSTWRFWESHPFSVAGLRCPSVDIQEIAVSGKDGLTTHIARSLAETKDTGITVFVRKHSGLTGLLAAHSTASAGIPVFVEGSYGVGMSFLQDQEVHPTREFPNLLCIAGGVGISAILPVLKRANGIPPIGTSKLYWGVRSLPLVHAIEDMLGVPKNDSTVPRHWGQTEVVLSVGERFNLRTVLQEELTSKNGGTTVVVCGPAGMADEVRVLVAGLSRHTGLLVRYVEESFNW